MPNRILITGASGLLGAATVLHFLKRTDWEVVGTVTYRHRGNIQRFAYDEEFRDPRFRIVYADLRGPISEETSNVIGPVDYVFHAAAESDVFKSIENPIPFVRNNIDVTLSVLEYCRTQPTLKAIACIGTDEIFGATYNDYAFPEWSPVVPSNPYSGSKAGCECLQISYWRTYGVPVVLFNTMNLLFRMQGKEKFLPIVMRKVYHGEEVVIHTDENGAPGYRYYLNAECYSDAVRHIFNLGEPAKPVGDFPKPDRYNVRGEKKLNNLEIAQAVAKFMGKDLKYRLDYGGRHRSGHDFGYNIDDSKLLSTGWKHPISTMETIQQIVEWTLLHKEWL